MDTIWPHLSKSAYYVVVHEFNAWFQFHWTTAVGFTWFSNIFMLSKVNKNRFKFRSERKWNFIPHSGCLLSHINCSHRVDYRKNDLDFDSLEQLSCAQRCHIREKTVNNSCEWVVCVDMSIKHCNGRKELSMRACAIIGKNRRRWRRLEHWCGGAHRTCTLTSHISHMERICYGESLFARFDCSGSWSVAHVSASDSVQLPCMKKTHTQYTDIYNVCGGTLNRSKFSILSSLRCLNTHKTKQQQKKWNEKKRSAKST